MAKKFKIEIKYINDRHETIYSASLRALYKIYEEHINNRQCIQSAQIFTIGKQKDKLLEEVTHDAINSDNYRSIEGCKHKTLERINNA